MIAKNTENNVAARRIYAVGRIKVNMHIGTISKTTDIKDINRRAIIDIEADDPRHIGLSKILAS
jgi:hypothetical protein